MVYAHQASAIEARVTLPWVPEGFFLRSEAAIKTNCVLTHDKNRQRAELWVKINVFNVFVMYALGSAHVKVRRLKRSRSFAVLFDKLGRIERQVDPNANLSNLIDSNADLYMCRI